MIAKYVSVVMLVGISILGAQNYYLNQKNNSLIATIEIERIAKQSAEKRLEKSEQEYKEYYSKYFKLREKNSELVLELNTSRTQLDDYKRRENVVLKKPSLVERRANNATSSLLNEYACITGNSRSCKNN